MHLNEAIMYTVEAIALALALVLTQSNQASNQPVLHQLAPMPNFDDCSSSDGGSDKDDDKSTILTLHQAMDLSNMLVNDRCYSDLAKFEI